MKRLYRNSLNWKPVCNCGSLATPTKAPVHCGHTLESNEELKRFFEQWVGQEERIGLSKAELQLHLGVSLTAVRWKEKACVLVRQLDQARAVYNKAIAYLNQHI